jgi:hypothetical protein
MSRHEREELERHIHLSAAEPIELRAFGHSFGIPRVLVYITWAVIIGVVAAQVMDSGLVFVAVVIGVSICMVRGGVARQRDEQQAPRSWPSASSASSARTQRERAAEDEEDEHSQRLLDAPSLVDQRLHRRAMRVYRLQRLERLHEPAAALSLLREAIDRENEWRAGELADKQARGVATEDGEYDPLAMPVAVVEIREAHHHGTPTSANTRLQALARRRDGTEALIVYTHMHLAASRLQPAEDEHEVCWLDDYGERD